jgi:membrane-bound lytic murein transglycosylase MltF
MLIIVSYQGEDDDSDHQDNLAAVYGDMAAGNETLVPGSHSDNDLGFKGENLLEPWFGDLDEAAERGVVRALVVPSKTGYFLDGGKERGVTYDLLKTFEKQLNREYGKKHVRIHVVVVPTTRDRLLSDLVAGKGDVAASNLTKTPVRQNVVDFSQPLYRNIDEVLVSSLSAENIGTLEGLSGKTVYIRKSSSFWERLVALNQKWKKEGREPVELLAASEFLEAEDILEMLNADMLDYTFVDNYMADFWSGFFPNIKVYPHIKLSRGGELAWAIRKNSPQFVAALNRFVKKNKKGTLTGNVILNRYFKNRHWVANAGSKRELKKYRDTIGLFQKYGRQYQFDPLLLVALGFQESRLDNRVRSRSGAIGIMQIKRSTAADPRVNIRDIDKPENNIHAGTRYLRFLMDHYFDEPGITELNRYLFTLASYNAGPNKVRQLRKRAQREGLDPNTWFGHVELVAARVIGRETVHYVSNVYKYYLAYKAIARHRQLKENIRNQLEHDLSA